MSSAKIMPIALNRLHSDKLVSNAFQNWEIIRSEQSTQNENKTLFSFRFFLRMTFLSPQTLNGPRGQLSKIEKYRPSLHMVLMERGGDCVSTRAEGLLTDFIEGYDRRKSSRDLIFREGIECSIISIESAFGIITHNF
jgi:hypothetical protein